jgi:hypothetical protein
MQHILNYYLSKKLNLIGRNKFNHLGGLEPLSTLKFSSRDEVFPQTYKVTTNPSTTDVG